VLVALHFFKRETERVGSTGPVAVGLGAK
jgi:hypothetical protein